VTQLTPDLPVLGRAPEPLGVHPLLNTVRAEPLTLEELRGSVVLHGEVRYAQIGEGNDGRTEAAIRALLA
jgi:hypothetical protein